MVHCGICTTGLSIVLDRRRNRGFHLALTKKCSDHNLNDVWQIFSLIFSGNESFMYWFKFHWSAPKRLLANLGLAKATCLYLDHPCPISPTKTITASPSFNGLNILTKLMHFYASPLWAWGVLSWRSGWAAGCQNSRTHISVTAWRIFSVGSSMELSGPVVVHSHGPVPICPVWVCPWIKNLSNWAQIASRLGWKQLSETAGWV